MKLKRFILLIIFFLPTLVWAETYSIKEVAKNKTWFHLLHYNERTHQSEIANKDFFYSPDGYKNLETELQANVDQILNESIHTPEAKRYSCRFPARKSFIEKYLNISPKLNCPKFEEWKNRYLPDSISFIFASQFIGNPASAFGHTFLRFDKGDRSKLLGLSLSYFAKINQNDSSLVYAYKGLFGGYLGEFEFDQYYPKAHIYGSIENRDIWEYKLLLSPEERQIIFENAYELSQSGQKKYYFLNRNCAFQLLSLIEVARNELSLTSKVDRLFLAPVDSIKILASNNLINQGTFYPSLSTKAKTYFESLNDEEKNNFKNVIDEKLAVEKIKNPNTLSAIIATLAISESSEKATPTKHNLFIQATNLRSTLPKDETILANLNNELKNQNPLNTHDTSSWHFGITSKIKNLNKISALDIGFRPAIHKLEDSPEGFLSNSQMVFLDSNFRIQNSNSHFKFYLQKFSFLDIKSFPSKEFFSDQFSWTAQIGYNPTLIGSCDDCHAIRTDATLGYSKNITHSFLIYTLLGPTIDSFKLKTDIKLRTGPTFFLGLIGRISNSFFIAFDNRINYFLIDPLKNETLLTTTIKTSWNVEKNTSLSFTFERTENLKEVFIKNYDSTFLLTRNF